MFPIYIVFHCKQVMLSCKVIKNQWNSGKNSVFSVRKINFNASPKSNQIFKSSINQC